MLSIILISHGPLSGAMIKSVELVAGARKGLSALELEEGEAPDAFDRRLEEALRRGLAAGEVVVVSDLVLGTPFNAAARLMARYQFCHLTGMSLPMLLALLGTDGEEADVGTRCRRALRAAAEQTMDVSELVKGVMV